MVRIPVVCSVLVCASSAMAAGINYVEQWDAYGLGESDATYNAIWQLDTNVNPSYPAVSNAKKFSGTNSIEVLQQNRGIDNNLTDGIGPNEMLPGQFVTGVGSPGDATDLDLGIYLHQSHAASRQNTSQYVEISMNGMHAPDPSNFASYGLSAPTDPLPNPIPVLAFGKLNGLWTGANGDGQKNTLFFFNGRQWINTFLGIGTNTNGFNRAWLHIGSSTVDAELSAVGSNGSGGTNGGIAREYLGGFNTISYRYFNAGQSISGTSATDDIWLSNGVIVPEPASLLLLFSAAVPLAVRRRRA
ncbi:MAG: hypothetical protein AMXMBFR13_07120 [Phycisphaerae bacterium]